MSIAPQISDIFTNLDNSRDRLIEFEEFKVSGEYTYKVLLHSVIRERYGEYEGQGVEQRYEGG